MLDVIDDFLWVLRREGFAIATPQAVDAARVVSLLGFTDRAQVRDAIACVVVDTRDRRPQYDALFDEFFSPRRNPAPDLVSRLLAQGFTNSELAALRDLLGDSLSPDARTRLRALLSGGAALDHLLASDIVQGQLARLHGPLQRGYFTQKLIEELGVEKARSALDLLLEGLVEVLDRARAEQLVKALVRELEHSEQRVRTRVEKHLEDARQSEHRTYGPASERSSSADPSSTDPMSTPFVELADGELDEVRRGVRRLAERLRGTARVKSRHQRRGRIDPSRTMRRALATGGVPFLPARRDQRRDRPRLVVLCDVSDSVRRVSRFMLEFVYAVKELFERTRSFVFVSELAEVTQVFSRAVMSDAVLRSAVGAVNSSHNSHYARALKSFAQRHMSALDRRTTVVILGDGRTNYQPSGSEIVAEMRARAKSVLWLCPEPKSAWGAGDSAMPDYATAATQALVVASGDDLESAARELVVRR